MIRIIDLSHRLIPGKQRFKLDVDAIPVKEYVPGYPVAEGHWYVMEDLHVCTHVGTHVEAPYHAIEQGLQAGRIDYKSLIGPAAILDFTDKHYNDSITKDEIIKRSAHIEPHDIVLIKTGLSEYYGTDKYKRPYMENEAIKYLIQKKIKCMGIDCSGIENKQIECKQENHRELFAHNIPLLEDLNNLNKLQQDRVFFMAFTLPIEGLGASLLRPIALEPLDKCAAMIDIFLGSHTEWESNNHQD